MLSIAAVVALMKRPFLVIVAALFASSASAGITYDFTSSTSGVSNQTIAGAVQSEGKNLRIDIETGDGVLFPNGGFVLSTDGGQTMTVVNPSAKTWYRLDLADVLGGTDALLKQLGDSVRLDVRNPAVSVTGGALTDAVEGFPTRKSTVKSAYEFAVTGLGKPISMNMEVTSDVWWTEKISRELTNFLQMRGLRTGVEAVDQLIAAQAEAIKGFPLRQVTSTKIRLGGRDMTTTTTSTVRNVKEAAVPAGMFKVPAGFRKTGSPIEKMFGAAKR